MLTESSRPPGVVAQALIRSRRALVWVGAFSAVVNILGLTGSFYMLQVYDRVLASRSVPTLVALSILTLGLFALQGVIDAVRSQVLSRVGSDLERDLLQPVHDLVPRLTLAGHSASDTTQPVRDLEALRAFMSGSAPIALLDFPWMPLYLALIFLLHPWLGLLAVAGMVVMVVLTIATDHFMRAPTKAATAAAARRQQAAETTRRNVDVLRAMGFEHRSANRFVTASNDLLAANQRGNDISSVLGGASKAFRTALQSAILGLGAYLVINGQMSAGAIIASSILASRAIAPVELAIANWKILVAARQARSRLEQLIAALGNCPERIQLPPANRTIVVEDLAIAPPGGRKPTVRGIRLTLQAGDGVAIVGPSGAGKSTLARALVGAWPTLAGAVRFDGAPIEQWPPQVLGRMIGYLPQDVELFEGTIAENIARLDPDAEDGLVVAAARAANVHELILGLPQGYATRLGEGGHNLSVGQRQRIGLARALYGDPFFVVLDEPDAHLDQHGELALANAIAAIRKRGGIVAVLSHRAGILTVLNLVAVIVAGELKAFGPRDEILKVQNAGQEPRVVVTHGTRESAAGRQSKGSAN